MDSATGTETNEAASAERDKTTGRFLPGNSGFGGRPKGAHNKLSQLVFEKLLARLEGPDGDDMIDRIMRDEPAKLLSAIVALVPRQIENEHNYRVQVTTAVDNLIAKLKTLNVREQEYEVDREAAIKTIEHEPSVKRVFEKLEQPVKAE
jgi:hypothetical protein